MSDWLPFILHHRHISHDKGALPDIGETPGIATLNRSFRTDFTATFERCDCLTTFRTIPGSGNSNLCRTLASKAVADPQKTTLINLPVTFRCTIFKNGLMNAGLRAAGESDGGLLLTNDLEILATRSFITWSYAPYLKREPLYETSGINWISDQPKPDFSAWKSGMPMQVIVPIQRPWLSSHQQLRYQGYLREDLQLLGARYNWGKPAENMLEYFY